MAGPVYHFDSELDSALKLPAEFDRHFFFYDWMRGRIIAARLDNNEQPMEFRRILSGVPIRRPMDLELGPDGALYLIEWGTKYNGGNRDATITRIEAIPAGESDDGRWNDEAAVETAPDDEAYHEALTHGEPDRGESLLRDAHHLSCLNCHRLGDHGGVAGPSFDNIGARLDREQILEAILHPSRTVTLGYGLITVTLTEDATVAGVLIAESDTIVEIETADRGPVKIAQSEIRDRGELTSTMPAFNGVIIPGEAADLVAYLADLINSRD